MPIRTDLRKFYRTRAWRETSRRVRYERAKGCCERCGAREGEQHPITGSIVRLGTAHLNHVPAGRGQDHDENLMALCQKCHLDHDRSDHLSKRHENYFRNRALRARRNGQQEFSFFRQMELPFRVARAKLRVVETEDDDDDEKQ